MKQYSPTGNGSIASNGVCNMCHNDAEPYWRVAKTLPPVNDFSGDGHAISWWNMEETSGTRADGNTTSGNDLTDNNTAVGYATADYASAPASTNAADFESSNNQYLSITNALLNDSFPLKAGGSGDGTFSVTFWYKAESHALYTAIVSKFDNNAQRSFMIRDNNGTLEFYIGYNSGGSAELLDNSLSLLTGRWYHIGATFNNTTKAWQLRVWDDTSKTVELKSGTATNNIAITGAPFAIGTWFSNGSPT